MLVIPQKREDTQTTIVALLIPYKTGCSLSQLCKSYYEETGEHIPWKELGYSSLMNFLESMSKSVQIDTRNGLTFVSGIASNKSKHISKLVCSQKAERPLYGRKVFKPSHHYPKTAPPKVHIPAEVLAIIIGIVNEHQDGVSKDFVFQKVQVCMPYTNITMSEMEEQLHGLSHKMYFSGNKIYPVQNKSKIFNSKQVTVTAGGEEDLNDFYDCADEDDFQFMPPRRVPPVLPTRLPAKVKSTSHFIKESVNATQFKCKSTTADDGFKDNSVKSEISKSHSYNLNNCNDKAAMYTDNNNYDNEEKGSDVKNNHTEELINSRIRFRLEKLIQNSPDGIWCADLPEKYLEEYKVSLNYTELGFSSVREFASQLPDIFHCVQINDTGDFILYHSKKQIPSINSKGKQKTISLAELHQIYVTDEDDEALPTSLTLSTCNQLIPEGIVTIGESVGQLNAVDLVSKEKPYIEVVVVEVFTPTFFWVQLRKKQKAFKTFMDDLHNFYVTKHQDYVIPPVILEKGLNCACIYNNIWHRGIIKTVKPDLQVTVMFYDYGTLKTYQPNEVYYLHRMFSVLSAQAIPCGLYNVRPYKSTKWTRKATHQFAIRTSNIPLIATVESQWINETDNSMLITLTDTLEEEDVHINDWLVEQKLAEHGKMVCTKKRNFPFHYYVECQKRKLQNPKTPVTSRSSTVVDSVRSVGKPSPKLQLLYEKLITLKRSSKSLNSNSQEFSDRVLANLNNKADDDPTPIQSGKEKQHICEMSNEQNNILRKYSNIPKSYAHRFHVQDPEGESNIVNPGDYTDAYIKQREFKHIDWSTVEQKENITLQRNTMEKIYNSISEKRENIPLAENYFLRVVKNSVHFAERDEDIGWLPSGNINKVENSSPLILRKIQKHAMSNITEKTIGIPKKILNLLMEKESSTEILESSTDTSRSISNTAPSASIQESSSTSGNDFPHSDDENNKSNSTNENLQINSDSNSISHIENHYIHMKLSTVKQKLMEILSKKVNQDDHSSVLDSDDLSEESHSNNDEKLYTDNVLHSTKTENINLDTSKLCIDRIIDKNESCEEFEPSASSESLELSRSLNKNESYEESAFVESSGLEEELISAKSSDMQDYNLTGRAIDEKALFPVTTATPSIPVFNDIDLESTEYDDEEYDVHIRLSDLHNFLKTDSPLNKNVDRTLEYDTRLTIEEVNNSGSSEDRNGSESILRSENNVELSSKIKSGDSKRLENLKLMLNKVKLQKTIIDT